MTHPGVIVVLLLLAGLGAFGLSLLVRRRYPALEGVDHSPWAATLSYVATAFGVLIGFSIVFLFGEFSNARHAVGDEATSIGTAFDQAALFPDSSEGIQQALICYGKAVPEYEWPAMRKKNSAPEVDRAYTNLVLSLGQDDKPPTGALHSATATNLASQVGSISTSRETRLVTANTQLPVLLWALLLFGGVLVVVMIFVVTLGAGARTQAALVGTSTVFTVVMLLIVVALATPFAPGRGRVTPKLIEETTAAMQRAAPTLTNCDQ